MALSIVTPVFSSRSTMALSEEQYRKQLKEQMWKMIYEYRLTISTGGVLELIGHAVFWPEILDTYTYEFLAYDLLHCDGRFDWYWDLQRLRQSKTEGG